MRETGEWVEPLGPTKSQTKSFFFFLGKEGALVCYQKWKEEVRSDFEWRREAAIYNS